MIETKEIFDESYYKGIWNTIHRHDYCDTKAKEIILKYGKCKVLDIGTGCGYLVEILREYGCEAWGLEISEYALKNKCSDFVLQGDVRNIPFKDKFFDVIHSNGLWEYIPEDEIENAFNECLRVGKFQEHNYDTSEGTIWPEMRLITIKSREWWNKKLNPKVLLACPNHECKEYSFQEWINSVNNFTYPYYDIFVVDTSPNENFYNKWKDKVNMIHLKETENEPDMCMRIAAGMRKIREKFLNENYTYWLNLESDVIAPSNLIEDMLSFKNGDWIAHTYPARGGDQNISVQSGVGCGLFSRKLIKEFDFKRAGYDKCPDSWLWDEVRPRSNEFKTMELWGYTKLKHL